MQEILLLPMVDGDETTVSQWDTEAHSANYSAYANADSETVFINVDLVIGPQKSSPIVGSGLSNDPNEPPKMGDGFGESLAIHEHDETNPLIAGGSALVAIGAPGDDTDGIDAGAVYVYRVGPEGLWWEAKITSAFLERMGLPGPEMGDGFGESVKFVDGYLSINSKSGRFGVSIPIAKFMAIG